MQASSGPGGYKADSPTFKAPGAAAERRGPGDVFDNSVKMLRSKSEPIVYAGAICAGP
jgi:hypothetical protein